MTATLPPVEIYRTRSSLTYCVNIAREDKPGRTDSYRVRFSRYEAAPDARIWNLKPNGQTITPRMNPNNLPEPFRSHLFAAMTDWHREACLADTTPDRGIRSKEAQQVRFEEYARLKAEIRGEDDDENPDCSS